MLQPHRPSQNLHAPRRAYVARPEDRADVTIMVVPNGRDADPNAGRAVQSGRSMSMNTRFPNEPA
jgi:hypothetical protein